MEHAIPEVFPCFRCGACCLNISSAPEISSWATKDGSCRYYDANKHECTIYDRRPTICNVWKTYKQSYEEKDTSWDDFVYTNMLNCCLLRYLNGIPESEGSPFEGMQEDVASALLHDLKEPRLESPLVYNDSEEDDDFRRDETASPSLQKRTPAKSLRISPDTMHSIGSDTSSSSISSPSSDSNSAKKEEQHPPKSAPASKREKLIRPDSAGYAEPLDSAPIDLDIPDLGFSSRKAHIPKNSNKHRGELL